jgi:hypothetical protein
MDTKLKLNETMVLPGNPLRVTAGSAVVYIEHRADGTYVRVTGYNWEIAN